MNVKTIFSVKRMMSAGLFAATLLMTFQAWAVTVDITKGGVNVYPGQEVELTVTDPAADQVQLYRWFKVESDGDQQVPNEFGRTLKPSLQAPGIYVYRAEVTVNSVRELSPAVQITVAYTDPTVTVDSIKVAGANKGTVNVEAYSGDAIEIKVTGADQDNGPGQENNNLAYAWTQVGGPSAQPLNGDSTDTLSFTAPTVSAPEQLLFRVKVTDDELGANQASVEKEVVLTVKPRTRPTASPKIKDGTRVITTPILVDPTGKLQGGNGADISFTLDGSESFDPDGGAIASYSWARATGTGSEPADPNAPVTSFTIGPVTGDAQFAYDLTVTDDEGQTSQTIRVALLVQPYQAPVLEVSQSRSNIYDDERVTFTVNKAEDPDRGDVTLSWELASNGSQQGTLSVADDKKSATLIPNAMGVNDNDRTFAVKITATDDDNASNSQVSKILYVTVSDRGRLPTATITVDPDGAQPDGTGKYLERHVIHVNGGSSVAPHPDCAGQPLLYQWETISGAAVTVLKPSDFGVDDEGGKKYWFEARVPAPEAVVTAKLTVTDCKGQKASVTKDFTILDNGQNEPPIAKAGNDRSVRPGEAFILNGALSSDPDGAADIDSYSWKQTGGTSVVLSNADKATANAVAPDQEDTLTFTLTVTDKSGEQSSDSVTINVAQTNLPPVAKASASPTLAPSGSVVNLLGSDSSDPEGGALTYKWVQVSGTPLTINNFSSANATFTAPAQHQGLEFELEVTDDQGAKSTARVVVNVGSGVPPKADAGPDKRVKEGETVTLNGRGQDDDGDVNNLKYSWRLAGGLDVVLDNPGSAKASFIAPSVLTTKTLTLELVVTDETGFKDVDQAVITVEDNGIKGFDAGFVTRNPVVDDNVIGTPDPIGFKVVDGDLVSLRAVPVSEYKNTQGKPEVLPFGLWEYKIKGANPKLIVKFGGGADTGTRWYLFRNDKWSEFKDEDGNAASFEEGRSQLSVQLRDGGSTDAGGATTDGFVTGTAGLGKPGVTSQDKGGRKALGGGGSLGWPLLWLMGATGWLIRRRYS